MKRRLNLMHLVWALEAAGMENGVINLCHRLPVKEFSPSICTLQSGGATEDRVDTSRVGLTNRQRRSSYDLSLPFRLASLMRRQQVDILHTHNWVTFREGIIAAKLAGVPVVVHGEHGKLRDRRRQVFVQRRGWKRVNRLLAVSTALADRMADQIGYPRDRIQVISNGVDLERFRPTAELKEDLRQQLGLPIRGVVIGMVARFVPFKDHAGVLRAVAELRRSNSDVHLALAGEGPLRDELGRLANQLAISDRVHFLGELATIETLLGALDILVSNSSHNEGMSNAILEGMACGVPVVATSVAASPELLDGGNAGMLVPPRDVSALVNALRQLVESAELRNLLSGKAHGRIRLKYDILSMIESYRQLYLELANTADARSRHRFPRVKVETPS